MSFRKKVFRLNCGGDLRDIRQVKEFVAVVREVWLGLGLVLFSAFFLQQCSTLNQNAAQYPRIILTVLLVLSAALLIQGLYYTFNPERYDKRYGQSNKSIRWSVVTHPLFVFGATVIYLILFDFINFFCRYRNFYSFNYVDFWGEKDFAHAAYCGRTGAVCLPAVCAAAQRIFPHVRGEEVEL